MSPASFENVKLRWYPEVKHYSPKAPIIVVGTKLDLKEDEETLKRLQDTGQAPITYSQVNVNFHEIEKQELHF